MREFLGIGGDYETFVQHKEQQAESGLEAFSSTYNNFPEKSLLLDSSESIESKIFLFQEEIEKTNNWEEDTEKTLNSFFNTDE